MSRSKGYKPVDVGSNYWRDIPGYDGKYQVSRGGEFRRVYRPDFVGDIETYKRHTAAAIKHHEHRLFIRLTDTRGKRKEFVAAHLVARAFLPPKPPGMAIYHKNHNVNDNRADNLGYIDRSDLAKQVAHKTEHRRPVLKINRSGEVVEVYRSARAAAKAEYMSYTTVLDRCNNKIKRPFELNGYTYQFEE